MVRQDDSAPPDELKTTLRMNRQLHRKLRILALERNTTFAALVVEALQEYLDRASRSAKGKTR